jgi:hypothetical protein
VEAEHGTRALGLAKYCTQAREVMPPIDHTTIDLALWRSDASILTWLEAL